MNKQFPDVHALSIGEIITLLETDASRGITSSEATIRNKKFGLNVYKAQKQKSVWVILELQARSSMNALRKMEVIKSRVVRDGEVLDISADQITLGDLVVLEPGDVIPGDGRLIEVNQLQCDESSLTGESLPAEKTTATFDKETLVSDQHNMVFKGSSVVNGNGKAIITGIAHHTQLGTITALVEASKPAASPLDKKLNTLSKKLIWVTLIMTAIFATTGIIQGKTWQLIIETSIALAVAAIPEGLPIVATIALAYGMLLMAKRNAIVKRLSAVETLGSTTVILTDKTGTLTENKIFVETFSFPGEKVHLSIENDVLRFTQGPIKQSEENFEKLRLIGTLCNDAILGNDVVNERSTGDPIEIALLQLTMASGANIDELKSQYERVAEIPFSSETKIMGSLHKSSEGNFVAAKGSVEDLVMLCTQIQSGESISAWDVGEKSNVLEESEKMSGGGQRVLAFAYKKGAFNDADYLNNLIYVGMIGFLDPPRLDIKEAVLSCRKAGIKVVMITGDHPMTALNIAKKTGLIDDNETHVITGKELPAIEDLSEEWKTRILTTTVFARTTPKQKLDIADIYQKAGNIVAMTGDGVNDAPALKKADVGIAMGLRGTQVAKETATIILKDDSFKSITGAVAHGREIFQNIQKFVIYLVSCNLSEILIVTSLGFIAPASTLLPLQILFLNMVTDVFPALALGVGEGDKTVMERPPRDSKKKIVTNRDWVIISLYAAIMTLSVVAAVIYCRHYISSDERIVNNVAFITLTFAQLFHVFNMSSLHSKLIINEITRNKFIWFALLLCTGMLVLVFSVPQIRHVLKLEIVPYSVWFVSIIAGMIPLIVIQAYKQIWKSRTGRV